VKFDTLLNTQKKVIKLFHNSLKKDRLVHTYLFEGAKGTAKLEAAYYLASLILCNSEDKPCMECEECRKILKEVHPSVFLVKPDNGVIKNQNFNFPQDRVTDHRIGFSASNLPTFMDGEIGTMLNKLKEAELEKKKENI
jgi:DNA polymerase III delta prime subunit